MRYPSDLRWWLPCHHGEASFILSPLARSTAFHPLVYHPFSLLNDKLYGSTWGVPKIGRPMETPKFIQVMVDHDWVLKPTPWDFIGCPMPSTSVLRGISEDDVRGRQGSFQAHLLAACRGDQPAMAFFLHAIHVVQCHNFHPIRHGMMIWWTSQGFGW